MTGFYLGATLLCLLLCLLALVPVALSLVDSIRRLKGTPPFLQVFVLLPLQRHHDRHPDTQHEVRGK